MIYKILMSICFLSLSACDNKFTSETVDNKQVEQKKVENPKSNLSSKEFLKHNQNLQKVLDNRIYVLLDAKEGCVVSEKPLNNDIVIVYEENEKFKYDIVKPILKNKNTDCVTDLASVTDEPNYFYDIDKKTETSVRGYGLELNKTQIIYKNGKIKGIDLIGNGIPNVITECFSKEGSHFNIWGGKNNKEKLLHRYTFLDMDMESSCPDDDKFFSSGLLDLEK